MGHQTRCLRYKVYPMNDNEVTSIVDFLAMFAVNTEDVMKELTTSSEWKLFIYGSSNAQGSRADILLKNSKVTY